MRIITLIIVIITALILLYRTLVISGVNLFQNNFTKKYIIGSSYRKYKGEKTSASDIFSIGAQALVFRLLIYFVSYLTLIFIAGEGTDFLQWWYKWDASNYIGIIEGGYTNIVVQNGYLGDAYQTLAFLPLYPALTWAVNLLFNNALLAALVTSVLCYIGGVIFLYMAVSLRYTKSIAEKAVILISVFPFSFYFGGMLPESIVLLTASACIYFSFKKKWWLAGIFGMLCTLAKLQGITILAFMGIEWLESNKIFLLIKEKDWKSFFKRLTDLIPMCITFLGLIIYFIINYYYTHDAFYFLKLQKYVWSHSFADCGTCIKNIIYNITGGANEFNVIMAEYIPELILFFVVMYVIIRCAGRHSGSLSIFLFAYTIISYSADWVISGSRYLSVAVPLFIMSAELVEKRPVTYRFLVCAGLALQVVFMYCHTKGINMVV